MYLSPRTILSEPDLFWLNLYSNENYYKGLKFVYSEKSTISTLLLSYVVPDKSKVENSQNFVAFSEYINFKEFLWFKLGWRFATLICFSENIDPLIVNHILVHFNNQFLSRL